MRDLTRYPITDDEILEVLRDIRQETIERYNTTGVVGDIRGAVVEELIKRVTAKQL